MQRNRRYRHPHKLDRVSLADVVQLQQEVKHLKSKLNNTTKVIQDVVISSSPCVQNREVQILISMPDYVTLKNPSIVQDGHGIKVNSIIHPDRVWR